MTTELQDAVKLLREELAKDPELYYAWQANIAMAFKDEVDRRRYQPTMPQDIHDIANTAAKNFLNLLIK